MNRYASANQLDYDVILRKNLQNEKLKQLEQIYLPRMDGNRISKKKRRDTTTSRNSKSRDRL
jgi:hypothetical protein